MNVMQNSIESFPRYPSYFLKRDLRLTAKDLVILYSTDN